MFAVLRELLGFAPTLNDFVNRLQRALAAAGETGWTYDAAKNQLRNDNGSELNLANMFLQYSQAPRSSRRGLIDRHVESAALTARSVPALWEVAARNIVPMLRCRYDYPIVRLRASAKGQEWPEPMQWPWKGDLVIQLGYDNGPSIAHVPRELVETWGQTPDAVFSRAIRNLSGNRSVEWEEVETGVYSLCSSDALEESFPLIGKVFDALPFGARAICALPNRGVLLAADGASDAAVAGMLDRAVDSIQNKPWPVTGTVFERVDGEWAPWTPREPLEARAGCLSRLAKAIDYGEQKAALDELHEQSGLDLHVGSFGLRQREDGSMWSWCAWGKGLVSSLPVTDIVAMSNDPETSEIVLIPWEALQQVCPELLRRSDDEPARYHVEGFPDDDAWARLGEFRV